LSDQPLKTQLEQRGYRRVVAACQEELLSACARKNITLAKLTAVKPSLLPKVLALPDFLFKMVAQRMLAIDPKARSSMWEDLQQGRKTEVEYLNGAVVALAAEAAMSAPANAMVVDLIHQVETGQISAGISAKELYKKLAA
ncbi:MAG: 2-dehydropantoate 2-reductase, partial [Gammaproteobacteria bacterium]|nr:2-dehydropantoate 2-reductase [Gammaproteobacteria bacterium]